MLNSCAACSGVKDAWKDIAAKEFGNKISRESGGLSHWPQRSARRTTISKATRVEPRARAARALLTLTEDGDESSSGSGSGSGSGEDEDNEKSVEVVRGRLKARKGAYSRVKVVLLVGSGASSAGDNVVIDMSGSGRVRPWSVGRVTSATGRLDVWVKFLAPSDESAPLTSSWKDSSDEQQSVMRASVRCMFALKGRKLPASIAADVTAFERELQALRDSSFVGGSGGASSSGAASAAGAGSGSGSSSFASGAAAVAGRMTRSAGRAKR
jgi:hypothetical protein